jgi:hypothetical protein
MSSIRRRMRTRAPTCLSVGFGDFVGMSMSSAVYHRDLPAIIVLLRSIAIGLLGVLNGQGMNIGVKVITGAGGRRWICKLAAEFLGDGFAKWRRFRGARLSRS